MFSCVAAATLGAIVAVCAGRSWWLTLWVVFLLPPGWYVMQPSADAVGACAFLTALVVCVRGAGELASVRVCVLAVVACCACHLVAGLVLLVVLAGVWGIGLAPWWCAVAGGVLACAELAEA